MDEPIDNERKTQTRKEEVSGMAPNWISLATNGPFYTETDLKSPRFVSFLANLIQFIIHSLFFLNTQEGGYCIMII